MRKKNYVHTIDLLIFVDTRVNISEDLKTSDILGVSAIIVADLIHKRMKDYTFDWNSARSVRSLLLAFNYQATFQKLISIFFVLDDR